MPPSNCIPFSRLGLVALSLLLVTSCSTPRPPAQAELRPEKLGEMDRAIQGAIAEKKIPGGVLWVERKGDVYHRAYGDRALDPSVEPMTEDTIFDAASLTKVMATTPAIMLLQERGLLRLDDPVQQFIPEFRRGEGKEKVTIRHLLTHTSGLKPGLGQKPDGYLSALQIASQEQLTAAPGTVFRYSDINFILLGEIVHRITEQPLEKFTASQIYLPLKMRDTGFRPAPQLIKRIAPTEKAENGILRGVVHDPTARRMGGVAGHAGLFTTAQDLARYARMLVNEGELEGVRIFKPETVRLMTTVQSPASVNMRRGLGWDIDSAYSRPRGRLFPIGSYGHTGWTGTCLWIDPFSKSFWIFLSNRVHPDGKGNVLPLQVTLGTLAAEAVRDFDFTQVAGSLAPRPGVRAETNQVAGGGPVLNGIDVLKRDQFAALKGRKVGLITNHTGKDRERNATIDLLKAAPGVELKALFSPEHGIRGLVDDKVGDERDEATGLPIFSLYQGAPKRGTNQSDAEFEEAVLTVRKPTTEQLSGLDALVFDIQDIGCRFYTYISTLGGALEAASKAKIKLFVLDRVNPINGVDMDGPVQTRHRSFIGFHPIPVRHGMTVGELAKMFNAELKLGADLTVIPAENWSRTNWFDATGLPWINPSPNMRSLTEATLYPGIGVLEFNPLSVGRGTDTPFEVLGAPYIKELEFAADLNAAGLPGVRFVPIRFKPNASKFKDTECGGVNIIVTDREQLRPVEVGVVAATILHRRYPKEFDLPKLERLLGHSATVEAISQGRTLEEIRNLWAADLAEFKKRREKALLYR